jgi:catechol 2,3-dioxygenase-like lactoylglutathione lyase family enzyme
MSDYFNAFELSPVPTPAMDAVAPEPYRGIYGMPMFITVPTTDLDASRDFWTRALGFIDLFSIPGRLTHLRRWAFQDVLLVPAAASGATSAPAPAPAPAPTSAPAPTPAPAPAPPLAVSFACVPSEIDALMKASNALRPGAAGAPRHTPWNTIDLEVVTPENVRVVFTAAKPLDEQSQEARYLEESGIIKPRQ